MQFLWKSYYIWRRIYFQSEKKEYRYQSLKAAHFGAYILSYTRISTDYLLPVCLRKHYSMCVRRASSDHSSSSPLYFHASTQQARYHFQACASVNGNFFEWTGHMSDMQIEPLLIPLLSISSHSTFWWQVLDCEETFAKNCLTSPTWQWPLHACNVGVSATQVKY